MKLKRYLIPILGVVFLAGLVAYNSPSERYFDIARNLDIYATLFKEVNSFYVDEINPNDLIRTSIDAMLASLDPYTNYIPEDEIEDYRTMTTNQYGGVGMLIGRINDKNMVLMPYKNFPAYRAGLKIGDELLKIDDIDVSGMNTSEISKLLKGQSSTSVTITVKRYGQEKLLEFNLDREKITINNVPYSGMVTGDIGYIKLADFTTNAGKEVSKSLTQLKEAGAKKVILDLRDNPGGLLNEAVNVANIFIPRGSDVVSTRGKVTDWNKSYKALNNPVDTEIPLIVLTNSRSASASEIVAGTMQDYDRGVLIGKKTFGKGLVQATRPLSYNSQLKVTTAKYYIPSGRCIQAINYSERNEDGSVKQIPDSLKVEFKTRNGRTVWDGGGIDPDINVERKLLAPITVSLITKGLLFDYATHYFYQHEQIPPAAGFKIPEADFNDFVTWLGDKDYDYITRVEQNLDELLDQAKEEKINGDIELRIKDLKSMVQHNKEMDVQKFREEIKSALEEEIASRYYLDNGKIEASFDDDPDIQASIQIFNDPSRFNQALARK